MYKVKRLETYIPIDKIFDFFAEEEDAVILESLSNSCLAKYSIIGRQPYRRVVKKDKLWVDGKQSEEDFSIFMKNYLVNNYEANTAGLPIVSGAIGFFSYDFGRERETELPECLLIFYDQFIIEDRSKQEIYLVANGKKQECSLALQELEEVIASIGTKVMEDADRPAAAVEFNFTKEEYKKAIEEMIHYIVEGDIYIANMTQRLDITSTRKPYEAYSWLRTNNPAPFSAYMNYKDFKIICSSPERFLEMRQNKVTTRPIKGTRKRGATKAEDAALKKELEESEKDKSELLMIVDLERNDLNRVCVPGSVKVDELFAVESYPTVHHLVSNISGILQDGLTVIDLLEAAFPGGSITGAPKIRAMEIIDELERGNRGLYTGSIGYIALNGDCDFNIIIRTAVYRNGIFSLGVGGGITCESDLEFEYEETLQKAKAIIAALS